MKNYVSQGHVAGVIPLLATQVNVFSAIFIFNFSCDLRIISLIFCLIKNLTLLQLQSLQQPMKIVETQMELLILMLLVLERTLVIVGTMEQQLRIYQDWLRELTHV